MLKAANSSRQSN